VPAFVDFEAAIYGTGDLDDLGVKAAPDLDGPPLDPEAALPAASAAGEARAREFLRERFPALEQAPLAASKCCRYELSADSHFVATRHPAHPAVWLYGGGSGHGFKHGPALAEQMAAALAGTDELPARFGLGHRIPGRSLRTAGAIARE
jgi:glycine/D-amino acid oxidase-like deaminating enzyme